MRLGGRLIGIRADTGDTADTLRQLLGRYLEYHDDVSAAVSVRCATTSTARGRASVPQLLLGNRLIARSRNAVDVLHALDRLLAGIAAEAEPVIAAPRVMLRMIAKNGRAVLLDAPPAAMLGVGQLNRGGVREIARYGTVVDGTTVQPDPELDLDWAAAGLGAPTPLGPMTLVGLVALEPSSSAGSSTGRPPQTGDTGETPADRTSRFAVRHPSPEWLRTVAHLESSSRIAVTHEKAAAVDAIVGLLPS